MAVAYWVGLVRCAERFLFGERRATDSAVLAHDTVGCLVQRLGKDADWAALRTELRVRDIDEFTRGFAVGYVIKPVVIAGHYRLVGRQPGTGDPIQPYDYLRDWVE